MPKTYNLGRVKGDAGEASHITMTKEDGVLTIIVTDSTGTQTESIETGEQVQANWAADPSSPAGILNKPSLSEVALTGLYTDLIGTPSNATSNKDGLMSKESFSKLDGIAAGAQVNAITGVKGNAETTYRTGEVNITPGNIGALATTDISDWAKAENKPTYNASEVGALPDTTEIPDALSDLTDDATHRVVTDTQISNWGNKYDKPVTGIPKTDLAETVQASLEKADSALQSYTESDPVFSASAASGISAGDISTWNGKQDALIAQTAYSTQGSTTKVPQITTNSLGQVTKITEVTIDQPDISGKADKATTLSGYGITDAITLASDDTYEAFSE